MMNRKYYKLLVLATILLAGSLSQNDAARAAEIGQRLQFILDSKPDNQIKVWIYFTNKGDESEGYKKGLVTLTPRAQARRQSRPIDFYDLPVQDEYITELEQAGLKAMRASRWLNAVSALVSSAQIQSLAQLDFIRKIEIVAVHRRDKYSASEFFDKSQLIDSALYGPSFSQNSMLRVDSLHKLGLDGAGVLLAFLDTGFRTTHAAFDSLNISDTYDFINDDADVTDAVPSLGQTGHGTAILSVCGGFASGDLIGPAYKADYLLAKTENVTSETIVEEDDWVLAAEWADSLGADIISSSLGYSGWYLYSHMDGNSAVTTIAADIAASRGILVVISAGNEGNKNWHYITAPADADSIMAVGAVNINRSIADFSSFGPTFDGRVKPELSAMGVNTRCANDLGGYTFKNGTSLSAPLISGLAALILQNNLTLRGKPMAIRDRLIKSSDRFDVPHNQYGYGIPDGLLAAGFGVRLLPTALITVIVNQESSVEFETLAPVGQAVTFDPYDIPASAQFDDNGDGTARLTYTGDISYAGLSRFHVAASSAGYTDTLEFSINTVTSDEIFRYGPNPFSDSLTFIISISGAYKIEIFSLAGEMVFSDFGNSPIFIWNGINQDRQKVASGVYLIRFSADGIDERVKVFKL